nr:FAR1 DNA binding domain, zinc finger, SWIM-type, MULE transposase domain, FHY3/FAR1 family [Tanacetum cinerariifolium]
MIFSTLSVVSIAVYALVFMDIKALVQVYLDLVEPSTPHLINNVQDAIIGDDQSVPQVGSYQPTLEGSKFWIPDAKNNLVEGKVFDTLELALKFYKDYAREAGFEVRRGGPTRAFNVMKEMYMGFENIGVTDVECRNYKCGLNNFIGKRNAQTVVEKLLSRQEFLDFWSNSNRTKLANAWLDCSGPMRKRSNTLMFLAMLCHLMQPFVPTGVPLSKHYLQRRWSKNTMLLKSVDKSKEVTSASKPECVLDSVLRGIYNNVEQFVTHLAGDLEKLNLYKDAQKTLTRKGKTDVPNPPKMNTNAVYASTFGVTKQEKLDILVLQDNNNKGNRIRTRLRSKSETTMKLSDKPKRLCNFCKKYANQDLRNLPLKKTRLQDENVDDVEQDEGEDTDMYHSD